MTASEPFPRSDGSVWRVGRRTFCAHPEQVLLPVLAAGVVWIVAQVAAEVAIGATITRGQPCLRTTGTLVTATTCAPTGARTVLGLAVSLVILLAFGQLFWAVCLRAGLNALGVEVPPVRTVIGPALGLATVLAVATTAGLALCMVPGVVVAFLGQFAMVAVVRDGRGCFAALASGVAVVARRPLPTLALSGLAVLVLLGGAVLGLVGVWPAAAVVALAHLAFLSPAAEPAGLEPGFHPPTGTMSG